MTTELTFPFQWARSPEGSEIFPALQALCEKSDILAVILQPSDAQGGPNQDLRFLRLSVDRPLLYSWGALPEDIRHRIAFEVMQITTASWRGGDLLPLAAARFREVARPHPLGQRQPSSGLTAGAASKNYPVAILGPHSVSILSNALKGSGWDFEGSSGSGAGASAEVLQERLTSAIMTWGVPPAEPGAHLRFQAWAAVAKLHEHFADLWFPGDIDFGLEDGTAPMVLI